MFIRINAIALIFLFVCGSIAAQQEINYEKDPAGITFVKNGKKQLNPAIQQNLRDSGPWKSYLQKNDKWNVEFNTLSGLPHRAYGEPVTLPSASSPEASILKFLQSGFEGFNIPVSGLEHRNTDSDSKYTLINFEQYHSGLKILWSNATFRLNNNGRLVMFGLDLYNNVSLNIQPNLSKREIQAYSIIGIPQPVIRTEVEDGLYILPLQEGEYGLKYKLVYISYSETHNHDGTRGNYFTLTDAHNGTVYYRQNKNHVCAAAPAGDVVVSGSVTDNPLDPKSVRPLPDLHVQIGNQTYYTDSLGRLDLPNLNSPVLATFHLQGRYSRVINDQTGITPSFTDSLRPGNNIISFDGKALDSEISAYAHVNTIHQHLKDYTPASFTNLDTVMDTYVEITSGSCNAFYDGNINFFAAGGGCPSISLINDVVFHEYGHGINYVLYDYFNGSFGNGALGEGYADVWGLTITLDPVLGRGFDGPASSFVRRYDVDPKIFPQDLVGESHADGEIIAGAWWDTYLLLGQDLDTMMYLFVESQRNTPMAPSGQEGKLFGDILLETLFADDDDGNIINGTPHDQAIINGFAKHGITLLSNAIIDHDNPVLAASNQTVDINARLITSTPAYVGEMNLFYRTDRTSVFQSKVMTNTVGINYVASIPAQTEGTIIEYYISVEDIFNNPSLTDPILSNRLSNPNLRYFQLVGFRNIEKEDFDNQFGNWRLNPDNTDNAQTGVWDIASPFPSFDNGNAMVQTDLDHSTTGINSNLCLFTGNASPNDAMGSNDVDDGETSIQSPIYDLSGFVKPAFTYWRWYVNDPNGGANPANDTWKVFISNNGTNWVKVERTNVSDVSWRMNALLVEDFVKPNSTVSFKFVASDSLIPGLDFDGGSIVEAAVDDLFLYDTENSTVGLIDPITIPVNIFPNPSNGNINMEFTGLAGQYVQIRISDLTGKVIYEHKIANSTGYLNGIDVSRFGAGVYMVNFIAGNQFITKEIVIH